jgi:hypothetical protein
MASGMVWSAINSSISARAAHLLAYHGDINKLTIT